MLIKVTPYRTSSIILVNTAEISRVTNSCNHSGSIIVMADGQRIEVVESASLISDLHLQQIKNEQCGVFTKTIDSSTSLKPADLKRQGVKQALELAQNWVDMGFVSSDELMAIAEQFKD